MPLLLYKLMRELMLLLNKNMVPLLLKKLEQVRKQLMLKAMLGTKRMTWLWTMKMMTAMLAMK